MIQKYLEYLKENKGISQINKIYTEDIFIYFDKIDKNLIIDLKDESLKLTKLNITINYMSDKYDSIFEPKDFSFINNSLCELKLIFNIPLNFNEIKLKRLITHEFNHIIEFYNLVKNNKKIPKHGQLKIDIQNFKKLNTYDNYFDSFIHYIYLTLDNEFNSRVAETYQYLKSLNTNDINNLINYLYNSELWLKIKEIELFDPKRFSDFLINKIGLDATIFFLNLFNDSIKQEKYKKIENYDDIIHYFSHWNKKFKYKLTKHKNKLLKIVDEVVKDY